MTVPLVAEGAGGQEAQVVDLSRAGLEAVQTTGGVTRVGAMLRLSAAARCADLRPLHEVIRGIGSPALRNLATVGGNLACRGDLATALLALDAVLEVFDDDGARSMTVEQYYRSPPGPPCLITSVSVSLSAGSLFGYYKLGRTAVNARAVVSAAAARAAHGGTRIALAGCGPEPVLLCDERDLFDGRRGPRDWDALAASAAAMIAPGTDSQASSWYRARVLPVVVARAIAAARTFA